jgi:hypothetical protein
MEGERMDEADWLSSTDPMPMLEFLRGKASDRQMRLFACACLRRIWRLLPVEVRRDAVHVFERIADGEATEKEFAKAKKAADNASDLAMNAVADCVGHSLGFYVESIESEQYQVDALVRLGWSASNAADAVGAEAALAVERKVAPELGLGETLSATDYRMAQDASKIAEATERVAQANVLREIVGNPFCQVAVKVAWLTWNNGTVPRLAQTIYDERSFDWLGVLADALEDAGCTDAVILNHCRQSGEHVRGCWAVDLILSKDR